MAQDFLRIKNIFDNATINGGSIIPTDLINILEFFKDNRRMNSGQCDANTPANNEAGGVSE